MDAQLFVTHARMEDTHWWFLARRRILNAVLESCVPPGKGRRVLDVCCGTGGNSAAFADRYTVVGVEPADAAVSLARVRFPGIEFIGGSAPEDVMDEAGRSDVFVLTDVLEHVEQDRAMVERLVSAAKPGAFFLTTVPANQDLWTEHDVSHGHFRRYTLESFGNLWRDLPVELRLLSYFNSRLYPMVYAARRLGQLRKKQAAHNDTDLSVPPAPVNRALEFVFAGEADHLVDRIGRPSSVYRRGVSVIGLFQKKIQGGDA